MPRWVLLREVSVPMRSLSFVPKPMHASASRSASMAATALRRELYSCRRRVGG